MMRKKMKMRGRIMKSFVMRPIDRELSEKVRQAFYEMVSKFSGQIFKTTIEPEDFGMGRELVGRTGVLHSSIYNRRVKRVGLKKSYETIQPSDLESLSPETFFVAELYKRRGFDTRYLASMAQAVSPGEIRVTLQTNDHPDYTRISGLNWKPVKLVVPEGFAEDKGVETASFAVPFTNPEKSGRPSKNKSAPTEKDFRTFYELCQEKKMEFERAITRLGGQRYRTENYSGSLILVRDRIWKLNSCEFTESVGGFSVDFLADETVGINQGTFLGAEIYVRPESRKYLAAITTFRNPDHVVDLETNDISLVRRSLDTWKRVRGEEQ
jgi:hypothetical protein